MNKYWMRISGQIYFRVPVYKACQVAITDGGLFTGVNERGEHEWQSENDNEMKTVCHAGQEAREPTGVGATD